jgi:hypothetical protein
MTLMLFEDMIAGETKESAGGERTRGGTSRRETRESKCARVAAVDSEVRRDHNW